MFILIFWFWFRKIQLKKEKIRKNGSSRIKLLSAFSLFLDKILVYMLVCWIWLDNYFWCRGGAIVNTYFLFHTFSKFHLCLCLCRSFRCRHRCCCCCYSSFHRHCRRRLFSGWSLSTIQSHVYTFMRAKTYLHRHTLTLTHTKYTLSERDHTLINDDIYRCVFVLFNIRSGSILFSSLPCFLVVLAVCLN